jgi:hypothetical protein
MSHPGLFLGLRIGVGLANVVALVAFLLLGHVLRQLGAGFAPPATWRDRLGDTVLPALGLLVLLAGVVCADCRWLLHGGAVVAVVLLVVCLSHPAPPSLLGALFLLAWLGYYAAALAWAGPATGAAG